MLTRNEWSKLHQAHRGGGLLKLIKVTAPHFRLVRRKRRRIETLNLAEPPLERRHIGFADECLHRKACWVHAPLFFEYFCKFRRLENGEFAQARSQAWTGQPWAASLPVRLYRPFGSPAIREPAPYLVAAGRSTRQRAPRGGAIRGCRAPSALAISVESAAWSFAASVQQLVTTRDQIMISSADITTKARFMPIAIIGGCFSGRGNAVASLNRRDAHPPFCRPRHTDCTSAPSKAWLPPRRRVAARTILRATAPRCGGVCPRPSKAFSRYQALNPLTS
jgi:hypothetical protein